VLRGAQIVRRSDTGWA